MNKEFKTLVKNASMLAGTRVIQFFGGLVRIKISAVLLGATGMGIVDQMTFLTNKMSQFTTVGTAEAFVKQIASNTEKENIGEIINSAIKSYMLVIFGFLIFSISFLYFFSGSVTSYVFGDKTYVGYFYLAITTFPLLVLATIPFSILKAFKNVKAISKARIYTIIIQLLIAIPLISIYKLDGAIAYIPLSFLVDLISVYYFTKTLYLNKYNISFFRVLKAPIVTSYLRELFLFSGFGLTVGVYLIVSEFICRSIVVSELGVESIGIYSPIILFSSVLSGFVLPALSTYLYPRFCEVKSKNESSEIINSALRLATIILIPLLFIIIPFQNLIIKLLYSVDFIEATKYLSIHFLGLIFFVWRYIFSQSFTPTGRIKQHAVFRVLYFTTDILVTFYGVKYFGLYGWMLKHVVSPFIYFWIYGLYAKKKMGFILSKTNLRLMVFLFIGSSSLTLLYLILEENIILQILGVVLIASSYFFLSKDEQEALLHNSLFKKLKK